MLYLPRQQMRILFIGDIVARPGREKVKQILPQIKQDYSVDLVIANAENIAHGRGATTEMIREMKSVGIDYFTGGDHLFWQKGFESEIDLLPVLRPANYPQGAAGKGYEIIITKNKSKVLLINLMGRTFLNERLDDPFRKADEILDKTKPESPDAVLVDFHAEATSEKYALGFYLDGRVNAVVGTHTHVPTCDARVLENGTAFVSDVGMTGNINSVLGVKKEIIIDLYLSGQNKKFEWEEEGDAAFRSVLITVDDKSKKNDIERVDV